MFDSFSSIDTCLESMNYRSVEFRFDEPSINKCTRFTYSSLQLAFICCWSRCSHFSDACDCVRHRRRNRILPTARRYRSRSSESRDLIPGQCFLNESLNALLLDGLFNSSSSLLDSTAFLLLSRACSFNDRTEADLLCFLPRFVDERDSATESIIDSFATRTFNQNTLSANEK